LLQGNLDPPSGIFPNHNSWRRLTDSRTPSGSDARERTVEDHTASLIDGSSPDRRGSAKTKLPAISPPGRTVDISSGYFRFQRVKPYRWPSRFSRRLCRQRHTGENFFGRIKRYRRIATRYEKLADHYLGFLLFTAVLDRLKFGI
jgi:transposase